MAGETVARLLDGRALAAKVRAEVAAAAQDFRRSAGRPPGLGVILVGDDPASRIYVRRKREACAEVGIRSEERLLPATATFSQVASAIDELNRHPAVDGILLQLPLPPHLEPERLLPRIDPGKDVDGFHPENVGLLHQGRPRFVPCTPAGVLRLLEEAGVDPAGRRAVVVGRSLVVGRPLASLLLMRDATVTVCHSRTRDLAAVCREGEILVVAVGRPELVRGDWIRPGATVIDVGVNRVNGRLVGDVASEEARRVAAWLTPVPGGVGPMTIAMLLNNTVRAARGLAALRQA